MADELAIFQERIRRVMFRGRWFFSVIDVVGVLTESASPRRYWTDMKRRMANVEGFSEVYADCVHLKMRAPDGKFYSTDAADTETMLRIVQSIASPKAEPFKRWLAKVGTERLEEEAQPSLAIERLIRLYRKKGYDDKWIQQRLDSIRYRTGVTAEWSGRGAQPVKEYAFLTDTLSIGTFDITTGKHKEIKGLRTNQNLQDSMTVIELALTSLADATAMTLHQEHDSQGFDDLQRDCHVAGRISGEARRQVEAETGKPVVSPKNYKQLQRERQGQVQPTLFEADDE